MSYKTILLILLFIIFQNDSLGQNQPDSAFQNLEIGIEKIIKSAIAQKAFPGCVVYVSQGGEPFLFKSYGYHTYDSLQSVLPGDIYDIASVTKITASTLALMKLYEDGAFALDDPINKYIDGLGWSKVGKVTLREAMAHQGGLQGWIKYYEKVKRKNGSYRRKSISTEPSTESPFQIGEGLYLHQDFYDKRIKKLIRRSDVNSKKEFVYSGLFFYLVPELVRNLSGMDFQTYLKVHFYLPMELTTPVFNPLDTFDLDRIVPTEIDTFFRMGGIHGKVHDEGAILMRGVSGNAGQFANAVDLARLWHMFLNDGTLDSTVYIRPATLDVFTSYQYPNNGNRRGLGFDKPLLEYDSIKSSVARSASYRSYGHTGFTGTLVWADPENDLLFIFLSNRVYPSRDNKAIYKLNVRPEIHQLLYDYIETQEQALKCKASGR